MPPNPIQINHGLLDMLIQLPMVVDFGAGVGIGRGGGGGGQRVHFHLCRLSNFALRHRHRDPTRPKSIEGSPSS